MFLLMIKAMYMFSDTGIPVLLRRYPDVNLKILARKTESSLRPVLTASIDALYRASMRFEALRCSAMLVIKHMQTGLCVHTAVVAEHRGCAMLSKIKSCKIFDCITASQSIDAHRCSAMLIAYS